MHPRTQWATAGIVALLCLTSCSTGPDIRGTVTDSPEEVVLQLPGEPGPAAAGVPLPAVDRPLSVGLDPVVCLSGPGSVTITGVRGRGATANLAVEDFAVRSNPSLTGDLRLGEERVPLAEAGFDTSKHEVDVACGKGGTGYEVGVQVARTGPGIATTRGFYLDWSSGDRSGSLLVPLAVLLCDLPTALTKRCDTSRGLLHE